MSDLLRIRRWRSGIAGFYCILLYPSFQMSVSEEKTFTAKKLSHDDDDKVIDFNKLEKELGEAVAADAKYWRENDAKFRAVHQKVATYDEFR